MKRGRRCRGAHLAVVRAPWLEDHADETLPLGGTHTDSGGYLECEQGAE